MAWLAKKIVYGVTAAGIAALGYCNWAMMNEAIDTSPIVVAETASIAVPPETLSVPLKNLTLSDLAETLARPLFMANRRPAPRRDDTSASAAPPVDTATPALQASPAQQTNLRLIGMISDGSKGQRALLQSESGPSTNWVTVGAEFAGWRLTSIEEDGVTIESPGARSVLKLHPPGLAAHPVE